MLLGCGGVEERVAPLPFPPTIGALNDLLYESLAIPGAARKGETCSMSMVATAEPSPTGAQPQILTAVQQSLDWKPIDGSIFRNLKDFKMLLGAYMFATGKSLARNKKKEVLNKTAVYHCQNCHARCLALRILRYSKSYRWILEENTMCLCGSPSQFVALMRNQGPSALASTAGEFLVKDWENIAAACFPAGSRRERPSQTRWLLRCNGEKCPGSVELKAHYKKGGVRQMNQLDVMEVIDCCLACKQFGRSQPSVPVCSLPEPPPAEKIICELCCEDDLAQWVQLPCGKDTCFDCLEKLVHTCPQNIAAYPSVVRFQPKGFPQTHCYTCPWCRCPFYPWTELEKFRMGPVAASPSSEKVLVQQIVATPFAFQSFNSTDIPSPVSEEDYERVHSCFAKYLVEKQAEALRRSVLPRQNMSRQEVLDFLATLEGADFKRLRTLRCAGLFERHYHHVENFLEAVELLYDRGLDHGFLQRVAQAVGIQERQELLREAFRVGWGVWGSPVNDQLVVSLLLRKKLVNVYSVEDS